MILQEIRNAQLQKQLDSPVFPVPEPVNIEFKHENQNTVWGTITFQDICWEDGRRKTIIKTWAIHKVWLNIEN